MANSRKSRRNSIVAPDLVSHVARSIRDIVYCGDRVVVALSGGIDSIVLLDILSRIAGRRDIALAALHVNHQISPNAVQWAAFCRKTCNARSVPLRVVRVRVKRGDSLEGAARAARYDVFRTQRADHVVLAHNQDDQAETLFLQLLRGAGVKGLSAMPLLQREKGDRGWEAETMYRSTRPSARRPPRIKPSILRPMLDIPRCVIEDYARRRKLGWIDDESNADTYFPRNFLRHEVLPLFAKRFPSYRATVARTARHLAEASQMLDDLAAIDGAKFLAKGLLQTAGLRRLSRVRAKNLLRYFLAAHGVAMPNADRLEEALRQVVTARNDAMVCIDLGTFELRRFAGELHVVAKHNRPGAMFSRAWQGEHRLAIPELNGVLTVTKSRGAGISLSKLQSRPVTIRVRRGGEYFRPDGDRPRRSLKNLMQEARIPPWRRDGLPLLFAGSDLVWVPEIGIACNYQASEGERSVIPGWTTATACG